MCLTRASVMQTRGFQVHSEASILPGNGMLQVLWRSWLIFKNEPYFCNFVQTLTFTRLFESEKYVNGYPPPPTVYSCM